MTFEHKLPRGEGEEHSWQREGPALRSQDGRAPDGFQEQSPVWLGCWRELGVT